MKLLRLLVVPMLLAVGACVSVPPPTVSLGEIASYKLTGVEVQGVEVVRSWPSAEKLFLASANSDPEIARRLPAESAQNFPAVQAFFRVELQRVFGFAFETWVAPVMRGGRPVKAVVTLKIFDVPSVARRVLVDQDAKIELTIDLVDPKTNAILLHYPGPYKQQRMRGGLAAPLVDAIQGNDDPGKGLIANYVSDFRDWLVTR